MQDKPLLMDVAKELADQQGLRDLVFEAKGASKETYGVIALGGHKVALKLIDQSKHNPLRTSREIKALLKCNTPLIGKLYGHGQFTSSTGTRYSWSMEEFLGGGTLTTRIKNNTLDPDVAVKYAISLSKALTHLKEINLVHRDIKPDNIMFREQENVPVLVDFGLVRDLGDISLTPSWLQQGPGTPFYSAPEQLNNEKHLISWKTDQFSLGVVLGICLTGQHPFRKHGMTDHDVVAAVAERKPCTFSFRNAMVSMSLKGIVKMIEPWPVRRFLTPNDLLVYFQGRR